MPWLVSVSTKILTFKQRCVKHADLVRYQTKANAVLGNSVESAGVTEDVPGKVDTNAKSRVAQTFASSKVEALTNLVYVLAATSASDVKH